MMNTLLNFIFLLYSLLPNAVTLKTRHEKINNLMIDGLTAWMSFFSYRGYS